MRAGQGAAQFAWMAALVLDLVLERSGKTEDVNEYIIQA